MNKDWELLGIQAICAIVLPGILYTYRFLNGGLFYFQPTITFVGAVLGAWIIVILLSILMMVIFFREAKKYTDAAFTQTVIFGLSLIPLILMMYWIISILCPQIVYWATDKYSWKKKMKL